MSNIQIPEESVRFIFSRSSGPGGQNVNKVNTQVTAVLDIEECSFLSTEQKALIRVKLANRIDKSGCLQITGNRHRSQQSNRLDVLDRMTRLIASALVKPKVRKATKTTYASKQRRLRSKKLRSDIKKTRSGRVSRLED
ncbi:MAG: aminoacyl-tRNA hydrolase [Sedimentisphaerales bacterium]|nr:aminoacyl-tRNA hydrolase [Sedimentisphaerales bacterium]